MAGGTILGAGVMLGGVLGVAWRGVACVGIQIEHFRPDITHSCPFCS